MTDYAGGYVDPTAADPRAKISGWTRTDHVAAKDEWCAWCGTHPRWRGADTLCRCTDACAKEDCPMRLDAPFVPPPVPRFK